MTSFSAPTTATNRAERRPTDTHPGRNRIHLVVDDLDTAITRLRTASLPLRSDVITGPGGRQILLADPDGNLVELSNPRIGRSLPCWSHPARRHNNHDRYRQRVHVI